MQRVNFFVVICVLKRDAITIILGGLCCGFSFKSVSGFSSYVGEMVVKPLFYEQRSIDMCTEYTLK